jgi:bacteriocin-like protein
MSKTSDELRELRDDELEQVSGGIIPGGPTDMGQVDTSEATARRPLGTICNVGWVSTKPVTVK